MLTMATIEKSMATIIILAVTILSIKHTQNLRKAAKKHLFLSRKLSIHRIQHKKNKEFLEANLLLLKDHPNSKGKYLETIMEPIKLIQKPFIANHKKLPWPEIFLIAKDRKFETLTTADYKTFKTE